MVGEVLQVIRSLVKEGMTMMIVTHEMKFAHDVSNRVFYMDEGGIYEEGTPEQIFNSPQKEKTRIFIKRLKQLPLVIENSDFDFIAYTSRLEQFVKNNALSDKAVKNILLVFEEAVKQGISERSGVFPISIMAELSETDDSISLEAVYGGERFDLMTEGDEVSSAIIRNSSIKTDYSYENNRNRFLSVIKK
jgi:polar amino acid transport system ATP-binding protein